MAKPTTNYTTPTKNTTNYTTPSKNTANFAGGAANPSGGITLGDTTVTLGSTTVRLTGYTDSTAPFSDTSKNSTTYAEAQMAVSFPTSVPSYADTGTSETLGTAGGGLGLSRILDDYGLDIAAIATKVGTGSDTAANNEVLVGNGSGTSHWSASLSGLTLASPTLSGTVAGTYTLGGTPSISGATITAPVIATSLDMNGTELILDADADTSLTADTDDQIDFKLSGADDFRMTANTFTALSGSTIATDTIAETTGANGVTVDGMNIKDGAINTASAVGNTAVIVGMPVQVASVTYTEVATGTTLIPHDDTIPQNTEGTQFMSLAITPKSTTNTLIIDTHAYLASDQSGTHVTGAIFQDTTANAIAAGQRYQTTANGPITLVMRHVMTAGTTSSTTFKFRAGATDAGTLTFNGRSSARRYGAIVKSSIVIWEIKAS